MLISSLLHAVSACTKMQQRVCPLRRAELLTDPLQFLKQLAHEMRAHMEHIWQEIPVTDTPRLESGKRDPDVWAPFLRVSSLHFIA